MGHIVGIDLGTTYSVVAVPEDRKGEGFLNVGGCPGYAVIRDKLKRPFTPSVVAEDAQGNILVGYPAKSRAGLSPEPIMFSKRYMGEDATFRLAKQGVFKPETAATHVLKYLKQVAEERLGGPVDEAVITVPAYFGLMAKQKTEEAGLAAGLKVRQILQEPVAAALMYCAGDPRPTLRLLTYDLGGGTFDTAVLEKRDGVISTDSIRAFDGNSKLGGYNFDQKLAWWIIDQLKGTYALELNLEDPADRERFAKFMVLAERAKIALTQDEHFEIQDPNFAVKDQRGEDIVVQLAITRDAFEDMIRKDIEETVFLCHRAREKSGLKAEEFDEILLVGGSSRIPLVARRLEQEFKRKPRLVEPDLCVALGAAVLAGTLRGSQVGCLKLDPVPGETDLPKITVTGTVVTGPTLASPAGCTIQMRAADGGWQQRKTTQQDGRFAFADVPLTREAKRGFSISVTGPNGAELASHRFEVKHSAKASGGVIEAATNILAKPIRVLTVEGAETIATERTPLPFQNTLQARTTDTSGEIRVPILEDNNPLGVIVMTGVPQTLPVGSAVEVTVVIHPNYRISGSAVVPALQNRRQDVEIQIPVVKTPTAAELEGRHAELNRRFSDVIGSAGRGAVFSDPKKVNRIRQLLGDSREMLQAVPVDCSRVNDQLNEVEGMLRELGKGWKPDPPRSVFDRKCAEAEAMHGELVRARPEAARDDYDKRLAAFKADAAKAETAQSTPGWKDAYQKVCKLCDQIAAAMPQKQGGGGGGGDEVPPDPNQILMTLAQRLKELSDHAKEKEVHEKFKREFQEAGAALKAINPKAPDAMNQIRDWYYTRFEVLRKKLEAPETGLVSLPPSPQPPSP